MCRRTNRLARTATAALMATSLLSGCATFNGPSTPSALGAGKHRSIKDDPEPSASAAPAQRKAAPKTATATIPRPQPPPTGQEQGRPTCATGSDCMVRLKAMIDDPSRSWIGRPQTPVEYANGTRLFAYRALRENFTCTQIVTALTEIGAAGKTFGAPVAGVSGAQAKHLLALNTEIERELQAEFGKRCRG
jgi:hypothetical protein